MNNFNLSFFAENLFEIIVVSFACKTHNKPYAYDKQTKDLLY